MLRLLFAAVMAFTLAACSTAGMPTQETTISSSSVYAFKTKFDGQNTEPRGKSETIKAEPRLGFAGFSGSQTRWGAN